MIKMVLTGLGCLEIQPQERLTADPKTSETVVTVLACAICRTDAKMWEQGHRDLVFPRVLGHEMVVADDRGCRYILWPGKSCGQCRYCRAGRENLCEEMKITGFHRDGGFAHKILVPRQSLIPIPDALDNPTACFAEPVGCVINAFEKWPPPLPGREILIFGGGTMGLVAALYARHIGLIPLILEKNEAKIRSIAPFLELTGIGCAKETRKSDFPYVITACPDYIALCQAITKADKGGQVSFFSGITKNETVETNLLNLVHYKEAVLSGAYGMTRSDMEKAVPFLLAHGNALARLVQAKVSPDRAPDLMAGVLSGKKLKYILDFTDQPAARTPGPSQIKAADVNIPGGLPRDSFAAKVCQAVVPLAHDQGLEARAAMDDKAKPLGALGRLEPLAVRMSRILGTLTPDIRHKALLVFAGDHGVTEEGVSAFPAEVTGQMVDNFLNGGAAINVLCRRYNIPMKVVDMGVKKSFQPHPDLIRAKVAPGTRNMAIEPAMTRDQAVLALENGMRAFLAAHDTCPVQIVGLGEMGIGNTTAASAIIAAVTGITPAQATGRGTGVDDRGLSRKTDVVERILNFHCPDPENGLEILTRVGGFEIAGIAGAALAAASKGCAVVLDGVISTAAGLIAWRLNPEVSHYFIAGHRSVEKAHTAALDIMKLTPVLDLGLRLGEGTGAALAMDLAETACRLLTEMATFDQAKISLKRSSC